MPRCPTIEALELFALARLPETATNRIAHHLGGCPGCQVRHAETETYLGALLGSLTILHLEHLQDPPAGTLLKVAEGSRPVRSGPKLRLVATGSRD